MIYLCGTLIQKHKKISTMQVSKKGQLKSELSFIRGAIKSNNGKGPQKLISYFEAKAEKIEAQLKELH